MCQLDGLKTDSTTRCETLHILKRPWIRHAIQSTHALNIHTEHIPLPFLIGFTFNVSWFHLDVEGKQESSLVTPPPVDYLRTFNLRLYSRVFKNFRGFCFCLES